MSLTIAPASSFQRPAGAALRGAGAGRRHQQGFFLARELAFRSRTRLLAQRPLQIAFHEAPLGPVDGRAAHADAPRDLLVAGAGIGRQQNLRSLELAGGMLAAAQQRREFAALGLAEFDPIAYIHAVPPCSRHGRTTESDGRRESLRQKPSRPSRASIWPSSTSTRACTADPRPKPTCSNISASARLRFTRWC